MSRLSHILLSVACACLCLAIAMPANAAKYKEEYKLSVVPGPTTGCTLRIWSASAPTAALI